ncbi:hypothetical protein R6Q59_017284 [Mikania micrantha]
MRNSIDDDDSFACRVLKHFPVDSEDEEEEEEESNLEMACPYNCSERSDALGLCVHLEDQHPLEIKLGVCPVCTANLGKNMISHLIIQHQRILKDLCKRKLHDDESLSMLSLLRKKLQEHSRTLQRESAFVSSSTNSATDPLLLSFVYNSQIHEPQAVSFSEPSSSKILPNSETLESNNDGDIPAGFLSSKDHEEKAQKSDFMQTILFSTIFNDNL